MKLKNGMIVHCDTREKSEILLKECHKQGFKLGCGENILDKYGKLNFVNWLFTHNTVYYLNNNKVTVGHKFYTLENDKTISFDELEEDKQPKIYTKPDFIHNDVKKVIINEPCVIVILKTGEKGISKCCPEDIFNEELGYKIAYQRAKIKAMKSHIEYSEKRLEHLIKYNR